VVVVMGWVEVPMVESCCLALGAGIWIGRLVWLVSRLIIKRLK
jgi:hypothetical protein